VLAQIELAQRAGVSPDTVVRWEGGKGTRPHPGALTKLAWALGVRPADLLED
jgi:transcriptional regulator with XRE-family HTH domain